MNTPMSRRTKLIILGIFLVLLIIPAAYVALTWSPSAPLRVRGVPGVHSTSFVGWAGYEVAVENVSEVSLRVYALETVSSSTPLSPNIYQMLPRMKRLQIWQDERRPPIPSRNTAHMKLYVEHTTPASAPPQQVLCLYASTTKDLAIRFLNWCYLYSPAAVRRFIPEIQPEVYHGSLEFVP